MHSRFLLLLMSLLSLPLFAQRGTDVYVHGPALEHAAGAIAGRGLAIGGRAVPAGSGRELVWRESRRETDTRGGTHVFYRQYVTGNGLDAVLSGSELAMHYLPGGRLVAITGNQFDSAVVAEGTIVAPDRALRAADRLAGREEVTRFDARRAARLTGTQLQLVQVDGVFRPAYSTSVELDNDTHTVVVDALSERVLATTADSRYNNCTPDKTTASNALGFPVRPTAPQRSLKASEATTARLGFSHEGFHPAALYNGTVKMYVYQGVLDSATWECNSGNYTLFPLKPDLSLDSYGRPLYVDTAGSNGINTFYGRAAGDALHHTHRTMLAFDAMGRKGWDNNYGPAHVVVNAGISADQMRFSPTGQSRGPANSLQIGPGAEVPNNDAAVMYNGAASLDWVAHEWGHGVLIKTANFDISTTHGKQLDEGFADVIGMIVEKRMQPSGTGLEQDSDWVMHEDSATSGYARGAKDDGSGHSWVGPEGSKTFNDRVHRYDGTSVNEPHATGNLLNVVHMLMSNGGKNPICARLSVSGCEDSNVIASGMGSGKAGSLLFHAIQHNLTSTTTWEQLPDLITLAAFERFNQCSLGATYNAAVEQEIVMKAFRAIGYPRASSTPIPCP